MLGGILFSVSNRVNKKVVKVGIDLTKKMEIADVLQMMKLLHLIIFNKTAILYLPLFDLITSD